MLISGIQTLTLLDYPGVPACIVFTPGCNFRCGFCHNPEFVLPENIKKIYDSFIPESVFLNFLEKRRGMLDGIVVSGGEPTIQGDLIEFINKIRELGFKVKLDTNGSNPKIIAKIINDKLVDYIAMDVKTGSSAYPNLVGACGYPEFIEQSIQMIKISGIAHEFRTTLLKEIHSDGMLQAIADMVDGAQTYCLQRFISENTLNPMYKTMTAFSEDEMNAIAERFFKHRVKQVIVRA